MAKAPKVRQRARRDGNHNEIVKTIRAAGASWFDTSNIAGGLDGVIGCAGIDQRAEIKNPDAARGRTAALKLTAEENDVFGSWRGRTPVILTSIEDAIDLLNQLRREANAKK